VIVLATLALLTVLAAGAGLIVRAGGSETSVLPPTGPAGNGLMAFSADGDIWVVNPDGSDRRQLTSSPAEEGSASWSRDGTRVAYWSVDASGSPSSLMVIAPESPSEPVTLFTDDSGRMPHLIDWSPDGKQIAFALCADTMCGEFIVVETNGTGARDIGGPDFEAYHLAWSPDGSTLAFGGRHGGQPLGLYSLKPDGTSVERISQDDLAEGYVTVQWSADGSRLLTHAGTGDGGPDVWAYAADGSDAVNLTDGPASGFLPGWSADETWVAFRDGDTVFVAPGAGGDVRTLGLGPGWSWSPDGTTMALAREGGGDLQLVDVESGEVIDTIPDVPGVDSWQRLAP
jgi:Tol biopolymer transport system component